MPRKKGGFRVSRKDFGFTWSCPTKAAANPIQSVEMIKDFFTELGGQHRHVIAREAHLSGKFHFHAYIKFDTKFESCNAKVFDIAGVHPNILNTKPGPGWIEYCKKAGDYISNIEVSAWSTALEMPSAKEAIDYLWEKKPQDMCKFGQNIERNVRQRMSPPAPSAKLYFGPYPKHFYPDYDSTTLSLLLWGPSGLNKTQFARYFMAHNHGDYDYVKGTHEALKTINFDKPFIHDEVNMTDQIPDSSKELTDVENGGSLWARFKPITIPPGVPRIFIANQQCPFHNPDNTVYARRVHTHHIPHA